MHSDRGLSGNLPGLRMREREPAILELAADLKDVADCLDRDWRDHGVVRQEVADRLNAIRERAERLFGRAG